MSESVPVKNGRRLTERRKLQNREAQRKYRQKAKNRLETLERELAQKQEVAAALRKGPVDDKDEPSYTSNSFSQLPSTVLPNDMSNVSPAMGAPASIPTACLDSGLMLGPEIPESNFPSTTTFDEAFGDPWNFNGQDESFLDFPIDSNLGFNTPTNTTSDFDIDNSTSMRTASLDWSATLPTPNSSNKSHNDLLAATDQDFSIIPFDYIASGKSPKASHPKISSRPPTRPFPKPTSAKSSPDDETLLASEIASQLRLDNTPENQSLIKTSVARGHNIRDVLLAGLGVLGNPSVSSPKLIGVHSNALSLFRTSTLEAYLAIARSMSMHIPDLYIHDCPSPFHNPEVAMKEDFQTFLVSLSRTIAPNLRPTRAQILHPHHPWLDLIPFPMLRQRGITLSATDPPLLDLADLKNDIFLNDGIFCWRNLKRGVGVQPWDMRSWEAEPWFLKKWWILLGGEDADVWKQTQWWRSIKGEENVELPQKT